MIPATKAIKNAFSALTHTELLPALRMSTYVVALFALAMVVAQLFSDPIQTAIAQYPRLGIVVFVGTSIVAVLIPVLTNLPLVPIAVLAWGPWWTAGLLLSGWVAGSAISFVIGRHAQPFLMRRFPSVQRHAEIDRLIDNDHRIASLTMLRMTFPVDVLSYALGLFSRRASLFETSLSTLLGGAPFAILFALFPVLSPSAQGLLFLISVVLFFIYRRWVVRKQPKWNPDD
ncbi:MAG: VTT domain-containing protein [Burkholderiaceae bacterium]